MGHGDRTGEWLEMVAVKGGNYTLVEDGFDIYAAQTECLYLVYFQYYNPMLLLCHLGIVVS
jgi:hypothetical protein